MAASWDDGESYLADPGVETLGSRQNAHLKRTEELLVQRPGCMVLTGDPGMGKTQTLARFFSSHDTGGSLRVEFRDVPDAATFSDLTIKSETWKKWRRSKGLLTLSVDGVDEGLIKITGFVSFLTGMLRKESLDRLQVILACRSREWPQSEGDTLLNLWQKVPLAHSGVFELCPLLERDVLLAARVILGSAASGISAEDFIRAIRCQHVIGLSSRPITLKMLISEFAEGGGFAVSHRELYLRSAVRLCNEVDAERRQRLRNVNLPRLQLDQQRRLRVAKRIAALLLLGGRSAIWTGDAGQPASTDLTIAEICSEAESLDGVEFTVDQAMVEAALETPLFWARGPHRAAFYHQTFAECLAAEYLKTLSLAQLRSLFCRRDAHGEFVHPPLGELASWLAASSPVFLQHLLTHDPETLLRSDVSAIKQSGRAALVDAVFANARAEKLFDDRGLEKFFHTLKHPTLAGQVRPVLCDRHTNLVTKRIALDMVERCNLPELFDDVATLLDEPAASGVHSTAAHVLGNIVEDSQAAQLIALFTQKRTPPLSAGAQLSLVNGILRRKFWTLTQALPHLGRFMSLYDSSGAMLSQHAVPADAEALLDAVRGWDNAFDGLNPRHALAKAGVTLGLARFRELEIQRRLARLWWRERRDHHGSPFPTEGEEGGKTLTQWLQDTELRRKFVNEVASIVARDTERDKRPFMIAEFGCADDFEYHLDRLKNAPESLKRIYAELVIASWDCIKHASLLGKLLAVHSASRELQQVMPWFRTWPLDDSATQKQKATHYEHEEWSKNATARRKPKIKPETAWKQSYAALVAKKPYSLLNLIKNLFYHGHGPKDEATERHDLRTSPGWKFFTAKKKAVILAASRQFVLTVPGNPHHPVGGNNEWDELAYRMLYALRDEIDTDSMMAAAVKQHWLPIIFDEFSNADEHHLQMVAIAYRLDSAAIQTLLRAKLVRAAGEQSGHCYVLREFARCWEPTLAQLVVEVAANEIANAQTVRCIADHLAAHDSVAALDLYRKLREQRATKEDCFRAVAAAIVSHSLLDRWNEVWPDLIADKIMAKKVLMELEPHDRKGTLQMKRPGAEQKLADLYLYLRELFPPAEDPRVESGRIFSVTPRMEIGRARDQLTTTLATWATADAIAQLGRIARTVPAADRIWIRWKQRDAIVASRRQTWKGVAPGLVMKLARKANRRLLEEEGDLLAVVLESLERFNRKLTRSPNSPKKQFWEMRAKRDGTKYFKPKDEVEMTASIASWLEVDLDPDRGITLQREVQVQWNERTDIEVRAVAVQGSTLRPLQLVIEVKGCWHADVRKAIRTQLAETYLQNAGWTHGVYLVVWTECERWNDPKDTRTVRTKAKAIDDARDEIEALAEPFDGQHEPWVIQGCVLDARL